MNAFIKKHHRYLVLALAVLCLQAWNFEKNMDHILARSVSVDNDGYWHLLRVQEIHRSGTWDNDTNFRGNAPFGEHMHWTRAMDLVLWAGATAGSIFTDFDSGLYWWAVFTGPVFYVLSLTVIVVFGRALFGKQFMILALLFLANVQQLLMVYSVNRPDHHSLVAFMHVLYYCLFTVLLERPQSSKMALLTGMVGGLGLWCGLEMLVLVVLSVLYLGCLWLVAGQKYLRANYLLALSLSVCLMVTVFLDEKPSRYWAAAYDKRSIVHVTLFSGVALFWLGAILAGKNGFGKARGSRLMMAIGGGVVVLTAFLRLFPDFIRGPMATMDPRLYELYLNRIGEFSAAAASFGLSMVVSTGLLVVPGFIYLIWAVHRNDGNRRVLFSWLTVTLCAFSALMSTMPRWYFMLAFMTILPNTFLLIALWSWAGRKRHFVVPFAATIALLCAPYVALIPKRSSAKASSKARSNSRLKVVAMLTFLESQDYTTPGDTVLADISIGPAIMYHTSLNAVGTLNHNNASGIIDTYRIFNAEDDTMANELIRARGVDFLLVDDSLRRHSRFGLGPSGKARPPVEATFIDRLSKEPTPGWLVEKRLPKVLADTFILYQVVADNGKNM